MTAPENTQNPIPDEKSWLLRYAAALIALSALWFLAYASTAAFSSFVVGLLPGPERDSHLASALDFFIYDSIKILLLLIALIYALAFLRATLNVERVRDWLMGRGRAAGYFLGAMFGSVTPFCSCSSIPLFLGFTAARIPIGATMAFLITSPLINEIAIVLLWGLLGWKFTLLYICAGMGAGILGGFVMDAIQAERWLQPFVKEVTSAAPATRPTVYGAKPGLRHRHSFALAEMTAIFGRVWKWALIGVAIGAILHGYVPADWFEQHFGAGEWWSVPAAVFVAIPLYSNVTGIVPIMESLLQKGLPLGTTLAFCMSAVAASLPEMMLLRQIMTIRLQAAFLAYLWAIFTLIGWLFNWLGPALLN